MLPGTYAGLPISPQGVDGGSFAGLPGLLDGFIYTDVEEFAKAITAGYGTDVAALTGGAAPRLESLESTLLATIQEYRHFVIFNELQKTDATATVDQWVSKLRIGGWPGSGFNSELGDIEDNSSDYQRNVGLVKFLMTKREVSAVVNSQQAIFDIMGDQNQDAALELLSSTEWGIVYGDSSCIDDEFDGILKVLKDKVGSDHFVDLRANPISANAREVIDSASFIADQGQFGQLTHMFSSNLVQADMNQKLDPAVRVALDNRPNSITIGTPVRGITTTWGDIRTVPDVFIQESQAPFVARGTYYATIVTNAAVTAPGGVAVAAAADSASQFLAAHAGNYYYAVESANRKGRSTLVKSSQVAVAAGDAVTIDITEAGGGNETCYVIHRSRRNGTNADNDFREMIRVAKNGGGTTTYIDRNEEIPGTSVVCLFSMGRNAITLRRLLPMTKFQLFPTTKASYPWAQLLFLYLRVGKPNQHRVLKNVLPGGASWKPF